MSLRWDIMNVFMSKVAILFLCRRQKAVQVDATVFTCISMLARAMGPGIQQDIKELLEPMLAVGLRYVPEAWATRPQEWAWLRRERRFLGY